GLVADVVVIERVGIAGWVYLLRANAVGKEIGPDIAQSVSLALNLAEGVVDIGHGGGRRERRIEHLRHAAGLVIDVAGDRRRRRTVRIGEQIAGAVIGVGH